MQNSNHKSSIIACSIFRKEIESLKMVLLKESSIHYLDSMLHMTPNLLDQKMSTEVNEELNNGNNVAIIYGECHACMNKLEARNNIKRIAGMNCIEIFLGKEQYRKLRKEGAFFLLPEWCGRWHEVFEKQLGLNMENAKSFMQEMHTQLIYIDTGVTPVPETTLNEISKYTGLPYSILPISLSNLEKAIINLLD
jgi:hypothetical protein